MLLPTIFLFTYFISFCHSSTVEDCNRLYSYKGKYNPKDCEKCLIDAVPCKNSLVYSQTCTDNPKEFKSIANCEGVYSECSTAEENSCKSKLCDCLKAMIDCLVQCVPKNTSVTNKKARSLGVIADFSKLIEENFGDKITELKKED
uniref:Uncharacterized protein n=1 Tax=Meloidogyne enterolobii TaxID=390850 RepID=A0A6V7Y5J2_MELEN|nr:unnamed protein product [Meloidogyne enterolobii]